MTTQLSTGISEWMDSTNKRAGYGWRFFQMGEDFSRLVQQSLSLNGQQEAGARAGNAAQGFGHAASAISATRFIFSWQKLLSGRFFHDENGQRNSWVLIAIDILTLIARTLSPLTWLHTLKAIDLGKHAARMSKVSLGAFSGVVVFYFAYMFHQLSDSTATIEACGNTMRETMVAFFDLLAFPFQCGFGAGGSPALGIAGCAISGLSGVVFFANEIYSAYNT